MSDMNEKPKKPILLSGVVANAASQLRLYDLKKQAQAIKREKKCDELYIQNQ